MGILDIISDIAQAIPTAFKIALIVFVGLVLFFGVVIPVGITTWENRDDIAERSEDIVDTVKEAAPPVLEGAKAFCEIDDTLLSQLRPNTIDSYMINNADPTSKAILESWGDSGEITACELKILDENLDDSYKRTLNLKSITKSIVGCNLVDCIDKYKIIEHLENEN